MKKIQGRTTDFIVTPDGRWQHGLSLIYVMRDIPGVADFKIIQEAVDEVKVLLKIQETLFPGKGESQIIEGFKRRMGQEVKVSIERVEEIKKDALENTDTWYPRLPKKDSHNFSTNPSFYILRILHLFCTFESIPSFRSHHQSSKTFFSNEGRLQMRRFLVLRVL